MIETNGQVSAASTSLMDLSAQRAAALAQSKSAASSPAQMKKAALDFEAILLAQWLDSAEKSFGTVPGGDPMQDPGHDQLQGIAVQHIAQAVAKAGGIGIGRMLLGFFERSQPGLETTQADAPAATEKISHK